MAVETIFKPSSRADLAKTFQNLVTAASEEPKVEEVTLALSKDPNGPTIKVPTTASPEEINQVLNSDQFINDMFKAGYLFQPGLDAEPIPIESLDDSAFTKQFKSGANFVKRIIPNIQNTIADIIDNESLQSETAKALEQYRLKAQAEQFFINDAGEVVPYELDLFKIFQDENQFSKMAEFVAGSAGNAVATGLPFLALRFLPPAVGAALGLFGGPGGVAAGASIGNKVGSVASKFYLASMAIAGVREPQLEVSPDPNVGVTLGLAPIYYAAERILGAPFNFSKVVSKATKKDLTNYTLKKLIKDVGITNLGEAGAETIQTSLENTAATLEKGFASGDIKKEFSERVNDPDFYKELANAGAMGFFGGTPFGVAGGSYKYIMSPSSADKDFEGSISEGNVRTTGDDIEDIFGKKINVSNITTTTNAEEEIIKDKNGNPVVPEFVVGGIVNINGEDYYQLYSTQGGKNIALPIKNKPNITVIKDPEPVKIEDPQEGDVYQDSKGKLIVIKSASKQNGVVFEDGDPKVVRPGMINYKRFLQNIKDGTYKKIDAGKVAVSKVTLGSQEEINEVRKKLNEASEKYKNSKDEKEKKELETTILNLKERLNYIEQTTLGAELLEDQEVEEQIPLINTRTHKANEQKLINRGYNLKNIRGKNNENTYRDDVSYIVSDNLNELSPEEDKIIEDLGYYKGPNGQTFIDRLKEDVSSKNAKSKTNGRLALENIIKNKIKYKPFTLTQQEKIGEEIVSEPLTETDLKKKGISLGIIDKYTTEEIDQAINNTTDPEEIKKLKAYKLLKSTKPQDRLKALQNIITGKYSDIGPVSSFNTKRDKFREEINKINRTTTMSPEEKAQEIRGLQSEINRIEETKTYINELLITLGLDTLTEQDFDNLKSVPKNLKTKILGEKKILKEKVYYRFWNKFNDITPRPPKLKESVYDDLPSMEADFRAYLLKTVGPNVEFKFVKDIIGVDGFPGSGFFQFVGNYHLMDLSTKEAEAEIQIARSVVGDPSLININTDPRLYTLHHEAMHAIWTMLTDRQKLKLLQAAEKSWIKEFKIEQRYKDAPRFVQLLEAISDKFAQYKAQQYQTKGAIKKIFEKIEKILRAIGNTLFDRKYQTVEDIFEEADLGIIRKRYLDRRKKELNITKAENIEQLTLFNRTSFNNWFGDSKVKGGTFKNMQIVGQGSNNANANLLIRERYIKSVENVFPIKKADIIQFPKEQKTAGEITSIDPQTGVATVSQLPEQSFNIFGDDGYEDVRRIITQSFGKMSLMQYAQVAKILTDAGKETLVNINDNTSVSAIYEVDNADEQRLKDLYEAIPASFRKGQGIETSSDKIPFKTQEISISPESDVMVRNFLLDIGTALDLLTGGGKQNGIPDYEDVYALESVYKRLRNLIDNNYLTLDLYFKEDKRVKDLQTLVKAYIRTYLTTPAQNSIVDLLVGAPDLFTYADTKALKTQLSFMTSFKLSPSDIDRADAPLVVFHGTDKNIETIGTTMDLGAHFGTAGQANRIIRDEKYLKPSEKRTDGTTYIKDAQVYPVMLSIQNPLRMPDLGDWDTFNVLEVLTGDTNKFQIVQNPSSVKIRDEEEAYPQTLYKPIFTPAESNRIEDAMESMSVKQQYKYLIKEIQKKGYDGIVYRNEFERDLEMFDYYLYDSYIAFKPTQIKSVFNNGNYDVTVPNILQARQFTPDPSDTPLEEGPAPLSRNEFRTSSAQFENKKKAVSDMFKKGGTQSIEKWSKRSQLFGHPKSWAISDTAFAKVFYLAREKERTQSAILTEYTNILLDSFIPAMQDAATSVALTKAFEISQQPVSVRVTDPKTGEVKIVKRPPGIFRRNENDEIVFVAQEDGKAIGSTVKKGEVIILRGNAATAYEDSQKAIAVLHAEVKRGLLADENTRDLIANSLKVLRTYRPDLINNGVVNLDMPLDQQENLTYNQLVYILQKLQEPNTLLQPLKNNEEVLTKLVPPLIGSTKGTQANPQGTGLASLVSDLKQYEEFKKTDYVPLQRYGNYYITVKDATTGKLIDYRQFNRGKFGTNFLNEEPQIRKELADKYGGDNYIISAAQEVDIQELRRLVGDDFDSLDSVAQFLSDVNSNAYIGLRKELDTLINKKVGRNIRGYSFYFKPRKELGGVAGFSNDFGRALAQYGHAASQAAASNRFNSSLNRSYRDVTDKDKQPNASKRKAYKSWFEYYSDPEQEFANIRRLGFWWYLGGNLSSAFLQLLSVVQIMGPYLSQFSNTAKTTKELARAFKDVSKMLSFKNKSYQDLFMNVAKENIPEDVREDFIRAIANSTIKQGSAVRESGMPVGSLNIKTRSDFRTKFRTLENTVIGGAFQTFETFARSVAFIAAHRLAQDPEFRQNVTDYMGENNHLFNETVQMNGGIVTPRIIAEELTEESFGLYNKINKPKIMRGLGAPVFLFQTYVSQMMGIFLRTLTSGSKSKKYAGQKIFARMMLAIALTGGFFALPGAEDGTFFIDLIRKLYSGIDKDMRQTFREMLDDLGAPPALIDAAENGIINAVANVDISKRTAFRFPGADQARAVLNILGAPVPQNLSAITGAPGAIFIDNSRKLFSEFNQTGKVSLGTVADSLLPTFLKNVYKGYKYGVDGRAFSSTGTLLTDDLTALDALWQSIGFTPTKISREREALRLEKFTGGETKQFRIRINNLITEGYRDILIGSSTNDSSLVEQGNDKITEALEKVLIFNSKMDPTYNFMPDTDALLSEALKDIYKNYRLAEFSTGEIIRNVRDRRLLGLN